MMSEKILTMVNAAVEMLGAGDKESFDAYSRLIREGKETVNICCTAGMLAKLKYELERDMAAASVKRAGKPNYRKALERIYKNVDAERRPNIAGVWIDKENRACVCDGYRALRLFCADELALDGLRTVDEKTAFDIDKAMPAPSRGDALELPTIAELNTYIKTARAEYGAKHDGKRPRTVAYLFSDGITHVNAAYLLDILTAFGDNAPGMVCTSETRIAGDYNCNLGAITFKCDAGDALLLPVRTNEVGGVC